MRPVVFTPIAQTELVDAQEWYESESPGLGRRFRAAVDTVVERMSDNPRQNVRRALLRRFPYALIFVIEPDESLTVVACFHGSRNPIQWQHR